MYTLAWIIGSPQELGDFGILTRGGWGRRQALVANFLSAATILPGGFLAYYLSADFDITFFLSFAAGNGPVKRRLLGSVSQAVALHAGCSVEIVRCPHGRTLTSTTWSPGTQGQSLATEARSVQDGALCRNASARPCVFIRTSPSLTAVNADGSLAGNDSHDV